MKTLIKSLILITSLSQGAYAIMPEEQKTIAPEDVPAVVTTEPILTNETVAKILPTDISDASTDQEVQKKILDNSVNAIAKSNFVKNNSVAQTAKNIGEGLNTEMAIGNPENGEVAHKINLKVLAFQAAAKLDYTGILKATAIYKASDKNVDVTITEDLTDTSKLQLMYQSVTNLSSLNFRLDW